MNIEGQGVDRWIEQEVDGWDIEGQGVDGLIQKDRE